jgi:hypothetical protein
MSKPIETWPYKGFSFNTDGALNISCLCFDIIIIILFDIMYAS